MKKNQGKVYRDKLNQLEDQLTAENRHYFDDLRMYMSMAGLLLDEGELNMQLYQLAADLLAAQADGVSAVDYFGNQPQEMADELDVHINSINNILNKMAELNIVVKEKKEGTNRITYRYIRIYDTFVEQL